MQNNLHIQPATSLPPFDLFVFPTAPSELQGQRENTAPSRDQEAKQHLHTT